MANTSSAKSRAARVIRQLADSYPDAHCSLVHRNALELLVATILSAQCTDERVNVVTKDLFRRYRTAADYAKAPAAQLEKDIQSTGFFRNKAKSILGCCAALAEQYDGKVPADLEALVQLPGVGRKTANVVLGSAFGIPTGVVVDTHVARLSMRMGLTKEKTPEKIEQDLMRLLPQDEWIAFSHRMIAHGRKTCNARKPACPECPMQDFCPKLGVAPR